MLQSGAGRDMLIRQISASADALGDGSGGEACRLTTTDITLRNGQRNTFLLDDPMQVGACTFADTGRDKNKYNISVSYSWLDSKAITHRLDGELLAKSP